MSTYNPNFQRRPEPPQRLHPKKVRGGIKLSEGVAGALPWASSWAAQRWIRVVESVDDGHNLVEGLQYAKLGQTKSLGVESGFISASIQGRADRPYAVRIAFDTFTEDQWHRVIKAMAEGAVYSAKLLSGELPANIEDLFIPLGLKLFPVEVSELKVTCTCRRTWSAQPGQPGMAQPGMAQPGGPGQFGQNQYGAGPNGPAQPGSDPLGPQVAELNSPAPADQVAMVPAPPLATTPAPADGPAAAADPASIDGTATPGASDAAGSPEVDPKAERWCKHACCAAYLFAERLTTDPFLMFRIRGLPGGELLDRLRHMRSMGQQGTGLYVGRVAGVSDVDPQPLDANLDQFWDAGPQLASLDVGIGLPPITHPLLRRLGPSPFTNSTFPLVGLLASCYDTISADVLKRAEEFATRDEPAEDEAPAGEEQPET